MQVVIDGFNDWSRGDLLTLAGIVLGVLLAVASIIVALWGWTIRAWRTERRLVAEFGVDLYLPEDIKNATRYYVRPNATSIDLAQEMEEGTNIIATREDLFKAVDRFLDEDSPHRHMLLLADSGMGKSSFVLNYYDYNRRKWHKRHKLAIIPLGVEGALNKIYKIKNQKETILFLDAFDEDPGARKGYQKRLDELMTECIEFRRILITCRTQFFSKDAAIPKVARLVFTPRDGQAQHIFWRLYIAPFNDKQVDTYLRRRFGFWSFDAKREARDLAAKVPKLTVRPMLLLHVPDLLRSEQPVTTTWNIYEIMVEKWYERELGFWKEKEALRMFSEEVAVQFYLQFLKDGSDRVSRENIASIVEQQKQSINDSMKEIDEWKATARSLLHRDSDGNWKFAHRSIMEFLFLKKFFGGDQRCLGVAWTDQMKKFLIESKEYSMFIGSLHGVDLSGVDLCGLNFNEANLSEANFNLTNFSRAELHRADLRGAKLIGAKLTEASLSGANIRKANLSEADLTKANLVGADLLRADLSRANLCEANFSLACLYLANLSDADLSGADLSGANLGKANLSGARLCEADLRNADLLHANLSKADLRGANLCGANLLNVDLNEVDVRGADLTDVRYFTVYDLFKLQFNEDTKLSPDIAEEVKRIKG